MLTKCLGYGNVASCVHQHVAFRQTSPRELRLKSKPWINPYIKKMMQYRDRLCPPGGFLPHLVSCYSTWRILTPILKMSKTR